MLPFKKTAKPASPKSAFRQKGATLTEYMLWVALVGVTILGASKLFSASSTSSDVNQFLSDLQGLRAGAQTLRINGQYTGLSMAVMDSAKALPSTIHKSGTNYLGNLNTTVTIAPNTNTTKFDLVVSSVPPEVCVKTLSALDGSWSGKIGATAVNLPATDIAALNTSCGNAAATITLTSS